MTGSMRFCLRRTLAALPRPLLTNIIMCGLCLAQNDAQQKRREMAKDILTRERPEMVSQQRWICISGNEPSSVKEMRGMGFDSTPDASDSCVAALRRHAKDHKLGEPYQKLLAQLGGNVDLAETIAQRIGASTLGGDGKVSIGNGKAITVTPPMAFDAGFTVAYTKAAPNKSGDPQKLKSLAESCLAGEKDAGTCFSVGYVYGAQSFNAK